MPGPTNTLLLSSGITVGFCKTLKLILAEIGGYLIAISCWGYSLIQLSAHYPWVSCLLKTIAALYVAWLSLKIWRFNCTISDGSQIKMKHVFITTILNPKAFLFASYIMPADTFTNLTQFVLVMLTFISVLLPVSFTWCLLGQSMHIGKEGGSRVFSKALLKTASLVLCFFSFSMLYDVAHSL